MDAAFGTIKSLSKITEKIPNNQSWIGTGFFLIVSDSVKCLITNYHIIDPKFIDNIVEISVCHKKFKLN